jgi:glycosyltransferase involved in cell wall biosynthesis
LEASACALPIVSTKHAGIPEAVVNGETGILVDEHDVKAMGQALIRLAENGELREKMGHAARRHMLAHYELAQQAQKLKSLL